MSKIKEVIILTNPLPSHNESPALSLQKFISIFPDEFQKISVVCTNYQNIAFDISKKPIAILNVNLKKGPGLIKKGYFHLLSQVKVCQLLRTCNNKNSAVFFWIADKMIIPFIYCVFKKRQIYYFLMGNVSNEKAKNSIKSQISRILIRFMSARSDYVCVESASVMDQWPSIKRKKNSLIIHLFVDVSKFTKVLKIKDRPNTIGMLTRLAGGKHVIEAIEAFSEWNIKNSSWKLQIIGDGPDRKRCQEIIARGNSNIELCGWVDNKKLPDYINQWKILLLPTSAEGLPNSLLECMACGTPALTNRIGGIPDVVRHAINGWFLRGTKKEEIIRGLDSLPDIETMELISNNAVCTVREKYSYSASCKNIRETIEYVTSRG